MIHRVSKSAPSLLACLTNGCLPSYDTNLHKKHTLFCGTKVVQAKAALGQEHVYSVVSTAGFSTAKGQLFNTILFPKPIKFKFYSDSYGLLHLCSYTRGS